MLSREIRDEGSGASVTPLVPHETPPPGSAPLSPRATQASASGPSGSLSEKAALRYATKAQLWARYQQLLEDHQRSHVAQASLSQKQAAKLLGISNASLSRMIRAVAAHGLDGLKDAYHRCGRDTALQFTHDEELRLSQLYLKTNRAEEAGSMQTACKLFALDPLTREDLRAAILSALERGRIPRHCRTLLKRITRQHFAAHRNPSMLATKHFSGRHGAFAEDLRLRRRVVESDDGTLNFPAWIPWPHGGDPVSDKYGVRFGRFQFLPALEAGWSRYYLGYSLVARPRGSYTADDIRALIKMVVTQHGLPDAFRFERGAWEANAIVEIIKRLGVELQTVWQSNQKPFIEGGFSTLWTYLSLIDGQVGRFRGEMEKNSLLEQKVRAGRADPRDHFPSLAACTKAIDGALALRNADRIQSKQYGAWIPEVRHRDLAQERPWLPLPPDLEYLFSPVVREWTVAKGTVGGAVTLATGVKVPFYFHEDNLWRLNGQKVRLYFDPAAPQVSATIVCVTGSAGYAPGEVICQASLFGEIPHFARAAMGWCDPVTSSSTPEMPSHRGPLSQVRRETRALNPRGKVKASTSEELDGRGNVTRAQRSAGRRPVRLGPAGSEASSLTHRPSPIERLPVSPIAAGELAGTRVPPSPIVHRPSPIDCPEDMERITLTPSGSDSGSDDPDSDIERITL